MDGWVWYVLEIFTGLSVNKWWDVRRTVLFRDDDKARMSNSFTGYFPVSSNGAAPRLKRSAAAVSPVHIRPNIVWGGLWRTYKQQSHSSWFPVCDWWWQSSWEIGHQWDWRAAASITWRFCLCRIRSDQLHPFHILRNQSACSIEQWPSLWNPNDCK